MTQARDLKPGDRVEITLTGVVIENHVEAMVLVDLNVKEGDPTGTVFTYYELDAATIRRVVRQ